MENFIFCAVTIYRSSSFVRSLPYYADIIYYQPLKQENVKQCSIMQDRLLLERLKNFWERLYPELCLESLGDRI